MKKITLLTSIFCLCLFISCDSDNDYNYPITPPEVKVETTTLNASLEVLSFNSLTGSDDGGVSGLALDEYKKRHLHKIAFFDYESQQVDIADASIVFTEGSDYVLVNGLIYGSYLHRDDYVLTQALYALYVSVQYRFEDGKFMVNVSKADKPEEWVVMGYGDQNKIEMYLDSKAIYGSLDGGGFYWDISGHTGLNSLISITPEEAKERVEEKGWTSFFEEVNTFWTMIPAYGDFATHYNSVDRFTSSTLGASWAVMKVVYQPTVE